MKRTLGIAEAFKVSPDALGATEATLEAAGRFAIGQCRLDATRTKFPAVLTYLGTRLGTLATGVTDDASPMATKFYAGCAYDAASVTVKEAETALDAAVAARVACAATSPRATQWRAELNDEKDASGQDLAAALYLEFGDAGCDAFLQNLTGLQKGAVAGTSKFGMSRMPRWATSRRRAPQPHHHARE